MSQITFGLRNLGSYEDLARPMTGSQVKVHNYIWVTEPRSKNSGNSHHEDPTSRVVNG